LYWKYVQLGIKSTNALLLRMDNFHIQIYLFRLFLIKAHIFNSSTLQLPYPTGYFKLS
jgi:hypothetical protein